MATAPSVHSNTHKRIGYNSVSSTEDNVSAADAAFVVAAMASSLQPSIPPSRLPKKIKVPNCWEKKKSFEDK